MTFENHINRLIKCLICYKESFAELNTTISKETFPKMAGFNKTAVFLLLVVASAMVITTVQASTHVSPCDVDCGRINREKDQCCKAHGYSYHAHCNGGKMHCNH